MEEPWGDWNRHLLYHVNAVLAKFFWQGYHQKLEHRGKATRDYLGGKNG